MDRQRLVGETWTQDQFFDNDNEAQKTEPSSDRWIDRDWTGKQDMDSFL